MSHKEYSEQESWKNPIQTRLVRERHYEYDWDNEGTNGQPTAPDVFEVRCEHYHTEYIYVEHDHDNAKAPEDENQVQERESTPENDDSDVEDIMNRLKIS